MRRLEIYHFYTDEMLHCIPVHDDISGDKAAALCLSKIPDINERLDADSHVDIESVKWELSPRGR